MNSIKGLVIGSVMASVLTGCMTMDPYTDEKKLSKSTKGSMIGAGAAALASYVDNRNEDHTVRTQRMLQAASVGGIAGGSIGYYMDKQEAKLRHELRDSGVSVHREGDNLTLIMPGNITFSSNSANVSAGFYSTLDSVSKVLKKFNKTLVEVGGHTDSTGSGSYNLQLSQQRATAVSNYLRRGGVLGDRLIAQGYGEANPIANNATTNGRASNRRVEITLIPIKK